MKNTNPKENFTAILPVTCNADCGFCPEKEMDKKADKITWLSNLIDSINYTKDMGYDHISLSGGEPTLDPRLLRDVIYHVTSRTHIKRIGITTNGQFLESPSKLSSFAGATTDSDNRFIPYFINISRHAFDTAENNKIMGVDYKHSLRDIINFRKLLPDSVSFRLNMVLTRKTNAEALFKKAKALAGLFHETNIAVAFRTDYNLVTDKETGLVPVWLKDMYEGVFGPAEILYSCPTCVTYAVKEYPGIVLKGADFEPTDKEDIQREFIFHQDGKLYHDWKRNKPFINEEKGLQEHLIQTLLGDSSMDFITSSGARALFSGKVIPTTYVREEPEEESCGRKTSLC